MHPISYTAHNINAIKIAMKDPEIPSQRTYFSKFSWGGMPPDPPSISMLYAC